jgi:hypothetical protein
MHKLRDARTKSGHDDQGEARLEDVEGKKVGRRRVPKGMGWDAASNPFWAASLGGNTTLPVGLFRRPPP